MSMLCLTLEATHIATQLRNRGRERYTLHPVRAQPSPPASGLGQTARLPEIILGAAGEVWATPTLTVAHTTLGKASCWESLS